MKKLTATEKERFQKAGIIDDVKNEYIVDMKNRTIVDEKSAMDHFGFRYDHELYAKLSEQSPFATVSMIDKINGSKKF